MRIWIQAVPEYDIFLMETQLSVVPEVPGTPALLAAALAQVPN